MRLTYRKYSLTHGIQKIKTKTFIAISACGLLIGSAGFSLAALTTASAAGGFNANGYNNTARIFNGTLQQWCNAKNITSGCGDYGFGSANDRLVMKWNAEWDRGNAENWSNPPYNAWTDNEWNGNVAGGSGYVWHYKIVWVGNCGADGAPLANGGYCIWGQFEVVMDQGVSPTDGHQSFALGSPAGYGAYYSKN